MKNTKKRNRRMATAQQKLLNKWIERNYETLLRTMPQKDMLHSAYITVYHFRRPFIPTAENFSLLMEEAYHRHVLAEINHSMHYQLPDPLFWLYHDEPDDELLRSDDIAENTPSHSLSDLSSSGLTKLFAFVKQNFPPDVFSIFRLAVVEQRSVKEIAAISGLQKKDVHIILNNVEQAIREDFHYRPKKRTIEL